MELLNKMKYSSIEVIGSFFFIYLVTKYCYCNEDELLKPEPEFDLEFNSLKIDKSVTISKDIVNATPIMPD